MHRETGLIGVYRAFIGPASQQRSQQGLQGLQAQSTAQSTGFIRFTGAVNSAINRFYRIYSYTQFVIGIQLSFMQLPYPTFLEMGK